MVHKFLFPAKYLPLYLFAVCSPLLSWVSNGQNNERVQWLSQFDNDPVSSEMFDGVVSIGPPVVEWGNEFSPLTVEPTFSTNMISKESIHIVARSSAANEFGGQGVVTWLEPENEDIAIFVGQGDLPTGTGVDGLVRLKSGESTPFEFEKGQSLFLYYITVPEIGDVSFVDLFGNGVVPIVSMKLLRDEASEQPVVQVAAVAADVEVDEPSEPSPAQVAVAERSVDTAFGPYVELDIDLIEIQEPVEIPVETPATVYQRANVIPEVQISPIEVASAAPIPVKAVPISFAEAEMRRSEHGLGMDGGFRLEKVAPPREVVVVDRNQHQPVQVARTTQVSKYNAPARSSSSASSSNSYNQYQSAKPARKKIKSTPFYSSNHQSQGYQQPVHASGFCDTNSGRKPFFKCTKYRSVGAPKRSRFAYRRLCR